MKAKTRQKSTRGAVIATTDGQLEMTQPGIFRYCRERLRRQVKAARMELIEVANPPGSERSVAQMIRNVIAAIEQTTARTVWIAEHDVIYPEGYFGAKLDAGARLTYANAGDVVYLTRKGFRARGLENAPFSTLAGSAKAIREALVAKLTLPKIRWVEPGMDDGFAAMMTHRQAGPSIIDIRYGGNVSGHREGTGPMECPGLTAVAMWEAIDAMGANKDTEEVAESEAAKARMMSKITIRENPATASIDTAPVSVSYVITAREEPLLSWTIANLKRTIPAGGEIIVVLDGWQPNPHIDGVRWFCGWPVPMGVGPSRDFGIVQATGDTIVILDSHMDFAPGWVEALLATLAKRPNAIACSRCAILRPHQLKMEHAEDVHKGAEMQWINEKGMPFEPVWCKANPGEIQLPLGACYAFRRERYMVDLCRVWQRAFGWGSSEHVISVANWFIGGTSELSDCTTGHVFRDKEKSLPYRVTPMNEAGVFYNRCRMIDLLPISDDDKRRMCNQVLDRPDANRHRGFVAQLFQLREHMDAELKAKIRAGRTYAEWLDKWHPPERRQAPAKCSRRIAAPPPPPARIAPPPRAERRAAPINDDHDPRFV